MKSDTVVLAAEGPTILIADDSGIVRKRVRALLEKECRVGQIMEADSAAEAWLVFKFFRPEVVILDLQFKDLSGLDVLRCIKRVAPKCVVFILSNHREPEVREECLKNGADRFLHKATEFEKVCHEVQRLRRR